MYEVLQFPLVALTSSWKVDSTKSLPAEQPEGSDLLINLKLQPADCYFGVKTGNLGIILAFFFFCSYNMNEQHLRSLKFQTSELDA